MHVRGANLLSLGVALPLIAASLPAGKSYAVELVYGFEENKPSGAFTLTTTR